MSKPTDPAFPVIQTGEHGGFEPTCQGITIRQYVATKAMKAEILHLEEKHMIPGKTRAELVADNAVAYADALLKRLEIK